MSFSGFLVFMSSQTLPEPSNSSAVTLGWKEKIGYASGDFASCLYFGVFMNFMSYFYTDVFGITAAAVGTMVLITRTWDWINDPIMGMIADRTRSKAGKFRPWLLWVLPFWIVLGILTFTTFDLSATGKLIYAYITYTLLTMAYTAINVPYSALMGVMTSKSDQRTVLSSVRLIGAFAGTSIVNASMLGLVAFLGRGNDQIGFSLTLVVYAVLSGAAFLFTFFATKERVQTPVSENPSIWSDIGGALKNGPWIALMFVSITTIMWIAIRGGATIHFFKYVSGNEHWGTLYLTVATFVQIPGVMLTRQFTRWLGGKKRAFIILNLGNAAFLIVFFFIPAQNLGLILLHSAISSFFTGPLLPLFWSMIADTADYGQWKLGHRATGLIFSTGTFSNKIGWSIGPAISMWLLSYFGFIANTDQSMETMQGLRYLMSFIPAAVAVLAAGVVLFYRIDASVEAEMEKALSQQS